jgi:hypothetical protein
MRFLDLIWVDLLAVAVGLYAVNSSLSGELRAYGIGGRSAFYRLRGTLPRIICALIGLLILAWVVFDLRRKFPA